MMWILGVLAVCACAFGFMYNQIVHAQMKVEEARSGIDVALSKRYAVLTNMQESVKGYVKHEREVLEKMVQLRKGMSITEISELNHQMNQIEHRLIALAESYPDLKASELFSDFQDAVVDCEEHLQAARRFYNSNVTLYNEKLQMFPSNLVAGWMNKQTAEFFEAKAYEKENIQTKF